MDTLISDSLRDFSTVPAISLLDLVISLGLSAILCTICARVYIFSHSGHSYSRSYVHTMVFVGITISLIMLIIGSNIARAFALVGALSIIRFRNPIKDSRDIAFIFMTMAIGMASGTKFYLFAIIFTIFISFLVVTFQYFRFGEAGVSFYVLRLRMKGEFREPVESLFDEVCSEYSVISIDRMAADGDIDDFIYEINLKPGVAYERVIDRIGQVSQEISAAILVGEASVNV